MNMREMKQKFQALLKERVKLEQRKQDLDKALLSVTLIDPDFVIDYFDSIVDNDERKFFRELMLDMPEDITPDEWKYSLFQYLYRLASRLAEAEKGLPASRDI